MYRALLALALLAGGALFPAHAVVTFGGLQSSGVGGGCPSTRAPPSCIQAAMVTRCAGFSGTAPRWSKSSDSLINWPADEFAARVPEFAADNFVGAFQMACTPTGDLSCFTEGGCAGGVVSAGTVQYVCPDNTIQTNPASCPANTCAANQTVNLSIKLSGPNPGSNEYVNTCWQGCRFSISQAQIYKQGEEFLMIGAYTGVGSACQPGNVGIDNGETDDHGDVSTPPNASAPADTPTVPPTALDAVKGLGSQSGGSRTSAIGNTLALPSLVWLNPHDGARVCAVDFHIPDLTAVRGFYTGGQIEMNLCPYLPNIDLIGGYLLYILTVIAVFGIWRQTPGS